MWIVVAQVGMLCLYFILWAAVQDYRDRKDLKSKQRAATKKRHPAGKALKKDKTFYDWKVQGL